uniref:Secreted protein n=1 Tax=Amblyomma triste TaxID=251400 RepID=A0A023GAP6_AMBTT
MRLLLLHQILSLAYGAHAVRLIHLQAALNTTEKIYLYLRTKDEMYRADVKCMYLEPNRPNEGYQYFLERGYKVDDQWRKANITATLAEPKRIGDPPTITTTRPHDPRKLITYTMIYWDEDGKCFILLYTRDINGNRKMKCEMYQWNEKVDERRGPIFSHTPVNRETVHRPCEQEYYDYCKDTKPFIVYDMIDCKGTNPPLPN